MAVQPYFSLDPQAQAILDRARMSGIQPLSSMPPVQARNTYRAGRLPTQPVAPSGVLARDFELECADGHSLPVREYRPAGRDTTARLGALVFFHGGGWVVGDRDTHDVLCRMLCHHGGIAVYNVDYRLAPECRFPAAFDDACAAVRAILDRADELLIDPLRLAVGGDSAGGNLAAAAAIAWREESGPALAAQLLVYPVTDLLAQEGSYQDCAQGYVLSAADMSYFQSHYVPDIADQADWRVSPLRAPSLAQLPPALVITAGYDPLRDQGRRYADRLAMQGNQVTCVCFERQMHGFLGMGGVVDEANDAVQLCAAWLRRQLFVAPERQS